MKKTVAIFLAVLMVISSISCLFTVSAAETENLFVNGDFADCDTSAATVTDWYLQGGGYTPSVIEGTVSNLPAGEDFNFVTFTKNGNSGDSRIYNYQSIKLQKNTSYEFSFWIKTNADAKSLKFFLYEPKYIKRDGSMASNNSAAESQNIYTYSYDNGSSTRVARTDIHHLITDSRNGFIRDGASSMASFASEAYPSTNGEWVQVTHTFTTGNEDYHVSNVRYEVYIPASGDPTEISLGGFKATATPQNVIIDTVLANNYDLGTVEPVGGAMVVDGDVTFTATPFANNKFLGWYKGGKLVSKDTTLTYTYNANDTEKYKAMFEAYGNGVSDGHESYTTNLAEFKSGVIDNSGSNGAWTLDSNDGSTWLKVKSNSTYSRSGKKSVELYSRYSYSGRNFTGLKQNTDYTLTFYSYMEVGTGMGSSEMEEFNRRIDRAFVTDKSVDIAWTAAEGTTGQKGSISSSDSRVLAYKTSIYGTGRWEKTTLTFNTGSSTDITLWFYFAATTVSGQNTDGCYIDDISLTCNEPAEEPDEPEEGDDTTVDFENPAKWTKHGNGSTQLEGYTGYITPESYVTVKTNTTKPELIKEGESSIVFNPQSRWYDYKLKGLKPNTKYALSFSYATNSMVSSTGATQNVILSKYGIFNYAAEGAKLSGVKNSPWTSSGYLHYIDTKTFTVMDDDGVGTPTYNSYSIRRVTDGASQGIAEVANTWYNTVLYFNSGSVNDTLAFVIMGACANTYLDDFELVEIKNESEIQEYYAPAVVGKAATGTYYTEKATTTLYQSVTEADFNGYKTTLANANFAEYATNAFGNNKFVTYVKGNTTVNVTYTPYNNTMLVAEQVTDLLPTTKEQNEYTDKGYEPLIIQLDHNSATGGGIGMSYIIRLADGSFIIVDGGHAETYFDNANRLYKLLREYTPEGEIQIAAWFLTHCHDDHISGFTSFLERYGAQINIEQLIYNFATYEQNVTAGSDSMKGYGGYEFLDVLLKLNPEIKVSTCHSGYKYNIRNAVIDIMYTLEDNFPKVLGSNISDVNDTSTTFKVSFTDENVDQTLLITGDSANNQCSGMLAKYSGTELEATFVQAIHHGIYYGSYALYEKMNPEVVLFPASASRLMSVLHENQNSYFVKEDSVKEVACSDYGTRVFALPYTAPEGLTGMGKFTLPAEFDAVNPLNSYVGASIRQAGENSTDAAQALRFKFQIPEHIIHANTEDGYAVFEYGMMVSEGTANLDYYNGKKAYVTAADGKKVYKAVAYNKEDGKDVVFDYVSFESANEDYLRSTQYTCALYNIGVGADGTTDYSKYDTTYYVRSYIAFKNANGDIKVYYGDTQSASVFAVMTEILKSSNTNDITYVKNFLDGNVAGFTADAAAIKEAWIKNSARASLYTPAN